MHILIQPGDDVPIYRQIVRQVLEAVASGRARSGDRMPSQRELAQRLVVSPLTVKKAYDELERHGVLETRRGQGTFVAARAEGADGANVLPLAERAEQLVPLLRRLLGEAWAARIPLDVVVERLRAEAERLASERTRATSRSTPPDPEHGDAP